MSRPPRVLVLGGGFAGLYAATYLARADVPEDAMRVTLVSAQNYFTFTPLLAEVVSGGLGRDAVVTPLRALAARFGFTFRRATVNGIDPSRRCVATTEGDLAFDYLVIAFGAGAQFSGHGALRDTALPFQSVQHALAIRNQVLATAERAAAERSASARREMLRFAVAGAGPSGVEVASEIHGLLTRILPRYYHVDETPAVSVFQGGNRILPGWDPDLAAAGLDLLRGRGIDVHLNARVRSYRDGLLDLDPAPGQGESTRAAALIWTAGITPATGPAEAAGLPRGEKGHLVVDEFLRVGDHDRIFAAGDVAQMPKHSGGYQPPVAPIAISSGIRAAGNIENAILDRPLEPYEAYHAGKIISLGHGQALADFLGWRVRGRPAWWAYRTIYLLKLVGMKNKLRAATSLALNRVFEPAMDCEC